MANKRFKKKEALNTATTKVEPKASNYTNNPDDFFSNNPDLLEDNHYRQNDQNLARSCLIEISSINNDKSIYEKCQDCNTKFSDAEDLKTHMENAHNAGKYDLEISGKNNITTCNECNKRPLT